MMSSQGMSDHQYIIKAENAEDIQTLTEQTLPEFMQPRCGVNGGYFQRLLEQSVSAAAGGLRAT